MRSGFLCGTLAWSALAAALAPASPAPAAPWATVLRIDKLLPDREAAGEQILRFNPAALRLAVRDMDRRWPGTFKQGEAERILKRIDEVARQRAAVRDGLMRKDPAALADARDMVAFQRSVLLRNPLLKAGRIVLIERRVGPAAREFTDPKVSRFGNGIPLGLPWRNTHSVLTTADPVNGWDNRIAVISDLGGPKDAMLDTLYKADNRKIITHLELDFDARRMMFTSIGDRDRWHVFEADVDDPKPRQITPPYKGIDFFDACYMPDGNVFLMSTAQINGLPCEGGSCPVGVPCILHRKTARLRQVGFDQDSSWAPSIMNDGRVLYLRYEYTDLPHYFPRIPFTCNPDGTNQKAYCLSNSYWPNALFGLRAVPGHPSKIIGTASGHHGLSRMGRLVILDPARGTQETGAAVQTIPGRGQPVRNVTADQLYRADYPKALTPWPLNDTYVLVSMKLSPKGLWGLYLADTFDNLTLICQQADCFYVHPILLAERPRPPAIVDRVDLNKGHGEVVLQDVHFGPGLAGIPRRTVKALRVFSYVYSLTNTGSHDHVGIESGWDIKRILGTVPVEPDGSAFFTVPANTPIAVQPLDAQGRALQLMRSWFTAMPGERLTCIGCHEKPTDAPLGKALAAMRKGPATITSWHGPARPFGFLTEVQPMLNRRCAGCHNGRRRHCPDLRHRKDGRFSAAYAFLQRYVRRPGPESDGHILRPMAFHASTSPLVQMLERGHHGVKLTDDDWDVLHTWIDLNAPYHGSLFEMSRGRMSTHWKQHEEPFVKMPSQIDALGLGWDMAGIKGLYDCRLKLMREFSPMVYDPEAEFAARKKVLAALGPVRPVVPQEPAPVRPFRPTGWPFTVSKARKMQADCARKRRLPLTQDLRAGPLKIEMVLIPRGKFGSVRRVEVIHNPYYISAREISLAEFRQFAPRHANGFFDRPGKDQTSRGHPLDNPAWPAVRVTWDRAAAFCTWLGEANGVAVALPTDVQWEWAARAGSIGAFWFGNLTSDTARYANFADKSLGRDFPPCPTDKRYDKTPLLGPTTALGANPWGLLNVFGNAAEWTATVLPRGRDNRELRIVRGGSFLDLPKASTADVRTPFAYYQSLVNVGFRIAMPAKVVPATGR